MNTNPSGFQLCTGRQLLAPAWPALATLRPVSSTVGSGKPSITSNGQVNWNQLSGVNGGAIFPAAFRYKQPEMRYGQALRHPGRQSHIRDAYVTNCSWYSEGDYE